MTPKVEQANSFAATVAAGQVYVRPEHVKFKRQAAVFSAAHARARGLCDALDAGMNALIVLTQASQRASSIDLRSLRTADSPRGRW